MHTPPCIKTMEHALAASRQACPPDMTMPWKRLASAALLTLGLSVPAMAQDATGMTVTPLHTFTGIGGKPAIGANPEEAGQGANPNTPPIHDVATGLLIGATHKGGTQVTSGVVYTLPAEGAAPSFASVNIATGNAASTNSPLLVPGEAGQYYLGVGGDFYRYAPDATNPPSREMISVEPIIQAALTAMGDDSPAGGGNFGQWAYGAAGDLPPSLYFARGENGGTSAYNLWRYDAQANAMHRLHKWPGMGTIAGGFLNARSALPTGLALDADGVWIYGVNNTTYPQTIEGTGESVPLPFVFRVKPDGGDYEVIASLGTNQDAGFPATMTSANFSAFSSLLDGGDGWLYGTTYSSQPGGGTGVVPGAPPNDLGTVYRISKTEKDADTKQHKLEVLHAFAGGTDDGSGAAGAMVKAADGNLYGATRAGGARGAGTLWRIVLADAGDAGKQHGYQVVHSFEQAVDGKAPVGLSLGQDGWTLYGAAYEGGTLADAAPAGANASGTVFKVALVRPPVTIDAFSADKAKVDDGGKVTLTWSASNATVCNAGGDWSGAKQASGEEQTPALAHRDAAYTFELTCSDDIGRESESRSVTVAVAAPPQPEPEPEPEPAPSPDQSVDDSGGGLALNLALLAPLAWLARRRRSTQPQ